MNLFVAGFIGSPAMSFLNGTVSGGNIQVGEASISLDGYDANESIKDGKATLGVRPEYISIETEARDGITVPATVEIFEPMGSDSLIWLDTGGQKVSVRIPSGDEHAPGSTVHLNFDISRASLFDPGTEARM